MRTGGRGSKNPKILRTSYLKFLKVDVEGAEIKSIPQWIRSGVLDKVDQIALEVHTNPDGDISIIRDLIGDFQG